MATFFIPGQQVLLGGTYKVQHAEHRLPHGVTLLLGQQFPPCARCGITVQFKVVPIVKALEERRGRIILNVLPVLSHGLWELLTTREQGQSRRA
jgi:hypothetical protein